MKKFLLGLMVCFVLVSSVSALSSCRNACGEQKNLDLNNVEKLRLSLVDCKPNFLKCVKGGDYAGCRDEYIDCKLGGRSEVVGLTIEANREYTKCVEACDDFEFQKLSDSEESKMCNVLKVARENFVKFYGQEKFNRIFNENGCGEGWGFL